MGNRSEKQPHVPHRGEGRMKSDSLQTKKGQISLPYLPNIVVLLASLIGSKEACLRERRSTCNHYGVPSYLNT